MKTILFTCSFICIIALFAFTKPKPPKLDGDMKKVLKKGFSYLPETKTLVDNDTVLCTEFFMMKTEITNLNYLEYLADLKKNNKMTDYNQALPDTLVWRAPLSFGEPYVDYYLRHPAYRDYPVVGVTKQQAENYCEWLTRIWRQKTGNESIVIRLPKRAEFIRAANGNSFDRPYAWNSPYLQNEKNQAYCNYLRIGAGAIARDTVNGGFMVVPGLRDEMGVAGILNDNADITAPVKSFIPNEFDIYHLNGNVAELVAEDGIAVGGDWNSPGYDIRNQSTKKFTKPSQTVGFRVVLTFVETK
jgi:formylglycine-generating enzyme required for sulfatase activity